MTRTRDRARSRGLCVGCHPATTGPSISSFQISQSPFKCDQMPLIRSSHHSVERSLDGLPSHPGSASRRHPVGVAPNHGTRHRSVRHLPGDPIRHVLTPTCGRRAPAHVVVHSRHTGLADIGKLGTGRSSGRRRVITVGERGGRAESGECHVSYGDSMIERCRAQVARRCAAQELRVAIGSRSIDQVVVVSAGLAASL